MPSAGRDQGDLRPRPHSGAHARYWAVYSWTPVTLSCQRTPRAAPLGFPLYLFRKLATSIASRCWYFLLMERFRRRILRQPVTKIQGYIAHVDSQGLLGLPPAHPLPRQPGKDLFSDRKSTR